MKNSTIVLNAIQIDQRIRRIAYEIYENNYGVDELFFVGVCEQGELLAKLLSLIIEDISPIKVKVIKLDLNKKDLSKQIPKPKVPSNLADKVVIIIDDVLNTGKTLAYSFKLFFSQEIRKIEIAVLINRSHTDFPIYPKYTGYELSTTLSDHIIVKMKGKEKGVYLL